ncbi:MAG TPA: ATP synthase F1 subunit gamma [Gemmatimonadales bacterium]|jgi:F-type H+-transporting ATPase subunit gamma|nr:ATP synthase F1 subunit gamma [Gemmatimonadales bacterium]
MAKSRQIKRRIRSIQNTRKITRTMELVSTSKLRRAQDKVLATRPYAQALSEVIASLSTPDLISQFPLLQRPKPPAKGGPTRAAVLLITSNRGLAGGFNANLIKEARKLLETLEKGGYQTELHAVGKKGIGYFKFLGRPLATARLDIGDKPTLAHAPELVNDLIAAYEAGKLASLDVIYARFNSAISTPPVTLRVLPVEAPQAKTSGPRPDFIFSPGPEEIVERLLPLYVRNQIYRGLVETAASEHGARRTAMKNATDNADELLRILTRTANRQRQAQITQELSEIVGGAAALEG